MCEWIPVDGKNRPDSDREVLLFIENDNAVYFGFCEEQNGTYQWWFNYDNDWHAIEEENEVICYLEYPFISKEVIHGNYTQDHTG